MRWKVFSFYYVLITKFVTASLCLVLKSELFQWLSSCQRENWMTTCKYCTQFFLGRKQRWVCVLVLWFKGICFAYQCLSVLIVDVLVQSYSLKRNILQFSGYVWAENEVIYVMYSVTLCISLFYTTILTATFLWSLLLFHTLPYCAFPVTHILVKDTMNSFLLFCLQQEKQRTRVKEKLDKCVKEKLVDFCDVLNIQINKAGTKKVSS